MSPKEALERPHGQPYSLSSVWGLEFPQWRPYLDPVPTPVDSMFDLCWLTAGAVFRKSPPIWIKHKQRNLQVPPYCSPRGGAQRRSRAPAGSCHLGCEQNSSALCKSGRTVHKVYSFLQELQLVSKCI